MAAVELAQGDGRAGHRRRQRPREAGSAGHRRSRPRAVLRPRPAELPAIQERRSTSGDRARSSRRRRRGRRHGPGRAVRVGAGLVHPAPREDLPGRVHGGAATDSPRPAAHQVGRRDGQHVGPAGPRGIRRRTSGKSGRSSTIWRPAWSGRAPIGSTRSTTSSRPSSCSSVTRAAATPWSVSPLNERPVIASAGPDGRVRRGRTTSSRHLEGDRR